MENDRKTELPIHDILIGLLQIERNTKHNLKRVQKGINGLVYYKPHSYPLKLLIQI